VLRLQPTGPRRAFDWFNPTDLDVFTEEDPITLSPKFPFDYRVIVPVLPNDFILMGEIDKYVTVSPQRFPKITYDESTITLTVLGVPNEVVQICVSHNVTVLNTECLFGSSQTVATLNCSWGNALTCDCQ